jgi:hypothetical protein
MDPDPSINLLVPVACFNKKKFVALFFNYVQRAMPDPGIPMHPKKFSFGYLVVPHIKQKDKRRQ